MLLDCSRSRVCRIQGKSVQYLYYKARTRGVVLHRLGGRQACTEGAVIHKVTVRKGGHKGCASAGTDARISSSAKVGIGCVIDRGRSAQSARHLVLVLVSEDKSNSRQ